MQAHGEVCRGRHLDSGLDLAPEIRIGARHRLIEKALGQVQGSMVAIELQARRVDKVQ